MAGIHTRIDTLNSLLRGEIAAAETYREALEKLSNEPAAANLQRIHADHQQAAGALQQQIRALGGCAEEQSGTWGDFARTVEGVAKIFGNKAALKVLKEGEEHGAALYHRILREEDLPLETLRLILFTLMPQTRDHIAALDRMMAMPKPKPYRIWEKQS